MKTARILLTCAALAASSVLLASPAAAAEDAAAAEAASAVAEVTGASASVDGAPERLQDGIAIGGNGGLRVHLGDGKAAARKVLSGRAVYANSDREASSVVQSSGDATQILTVIDGANAPSSYTFRFDLPAGARLAPTAGGRVEIQFGDVTVGEVDAPWAVDAEGKPVATNYEVQGDTLIQHVAHDGAAYPVTADPRVTFGRYAYVTFNRSETTNLAGYSSFAALVNAACAMIPVAPGRAACIVITGATAISVGNTFKNAARQSGKCAQMRFLYFPPPIWGGFAGASVVNC